MHHSLHSLFDHKAPTTNRQLYSRILIAHGTITRFPNFNSYQLTTRTVRGGGKEWMQGGALHLAVSCLASALGGMRSCDIAILSGYTWVNSWPPHHGWISVAVNRIRSHRNASAPVCSRLKSPSTPIPRRPPVHGAGGHVTPVRRPTGAFTIVGRERRTDHRCREMLKQHTNTRPQTLKPCLLFR